MVDSLLMVELHDFGRPSTRLENVRQFDAIVRQDD